MEHINYFTDCSDAELVKLWEVYETNNVAPENDPFRPYLDKYANSPTKIPLVLCEVDFLRTCAKRFYENRNININKSFGFAKVDALKFGKF